MTLSLYNTLTREKSAFKPIDPKNVRMYACGPTVYDFAHIGNARMVVVFDVLFRTLRAIYGEKHVTYVRNITDIDDKIITAAAAKGEPIGALTARTEQQFNADMAAIGCVMPTHTPRATEYVPQMLEMIAALIARGNAYEAEGHVLFNVPSMKNYGGLSRRNMDEMIAGARVDVAPYKKDAADFVLWKPSAPEQPGWDSPYGRGRPGWHIECSVMAGALLGPTFDIHGGGIDLIFPHHENEIAQSCCAHGTDCLANVWMHNGFITVNGEKMSKSLGNFFTVHDLLQTWDGEVIRYALLSAHYRQPLDFTEELLQQSKASLDKTYLALRGHKIEAEPDVLAESGFLDDLNTPMALTKIHEWTTALNKHDYNAIDKIRALGKILGLFQKDSDEWLQGDADAELIENKIRARYAAKASKDFKAADAIRDELNAMGIILEDTPNGTTWRRA
jgi:cysteinyl-tRNA synthetase